MARTKSRVSIELGVQRWKLCDEVRPVGRDDEMIGIKMDGFKEKGLRMNLMVENGFK
ncbi:hypothetical protein PIB30_065653 [Stylosanthes scabra]|uniref:Uncharacterized protein n=1 Tax=Stylosanthes scabra TaxID=79078 RepID=A0ABU6UL26_9FABA|nr:hypothetical protein [Stylosanthes scabra]